MIDSWYFLHQGHFANFREQKSCGAIKWWERKKVCFVSLDFSVPEGGQTKRTTYNHSSAQASRGGHKHSWKESRENLSVCCKFISIQLDMVLPDRSITPHPSSFSASPHLISPRVKTAYAQGFLFFHLIKLKCINVVWNEVKSLVFAAPPRQPVVYYFIPIDDFILLCHLAACEAP